MPIIIALIIAIFLILISWTWHNLGSIEKSRKTIIIIVALIVLLIVTLVVFNISKRDLPYKNHEEADAVRNILVILFTFINGIIVMPAIAKVINKVNEKEIDANQATKRMFLILIIFVIILIFECGYLKDIQKGILNMYQSKLNK